MRDIVDDVDWLIASKLKNVIEGEIDSLTTQYLVYPVQNQNTCQSEYFSGEKSIHYSGLLEASSGVSNSFTALFWLMHLRLELDPSYVIQDKRGEDHKIETDFAYQAESLWLVSDDPHEMFDKDLVDKVKKALLEVNELEFTPEIRNAGFDYALGLVDEYQDAYL